MASTENRVVAEAIDEDTGYQITPEEAEILEAFTGQVKKAHPGIRLMVAEDGSVTSTHENRAIGEVLLMTALGTVQADFLSGMVKQLINAGSQGQEIDECGVNFLLSVIKGVEPQDEVESMLAAQMASTHVAVMTFARRLAHCETIEQQDSAERTYNKLARTFTAQVEALKRYRTGGEQKVTVEHVTVNEGGQAIVGIANGGGGGRGKTGKQPHEQVTHAPEPTLHGDLEADAEALPGAGREGVERMPLPRRQRRGAKG